MQNHNDTTGQPLPQVARGALINFAGVAARSVIVYVFTFVIARQLSTTDLGRFFLMSTIINMLGILCVLGMGIGVVRYVALYYGEKNYRFVRQTLWSSLKIVVPFSVAMAAGLILLAPVISDRYFEGEPLATGGLRIFAIAVPCLAVARLFNSTTQGLHQMRYQVYARDIGEQVSKLGFTVPLLFAGAGLIGLVLANVASAVVAVALSAYFALLILPKVRSATGGAASGDEAERLQAGQAEAQAKGYPTWHLFLYSLPQAFSTLVLQGQLWIDTLLLGALSTAADVGLYGVALKIAVFSSMVDNGFATVFSPMISDLWNRKRVEDLKLLFKTTTRWIFTFSFPIFMVIVMFAGPVMRIFGGKFEDASTALILLAVGQLAASGTGNVGLMVLMTGRWNSFLELFNVFMGLVVNAVLCLALIPSHGFTGAAFANMASVFTVNLMRAGETLFLLKMHAYDRNYLKPLGAGLAAAAVTYAVAHFVLAPSDAVRLLALVALYGIVYLALLLLAGLNDKDKELIEMARQRLLGTKGHQPEGGVV